MRGARGRRSLAAALRTIGYSLAAVALFVLALCLAAFAMMSCGYTETEMQLQRDRADQLQSLLEKCEAAARATAAQVRACRRQ